MKSLVKSIVVLSLMTLIQSAVGQENAPEPSLTLTDLATVSKVAAPPSPSLLLKNTITGDTTSTVGEIDLNYYSNSTCDSASLGQKNTNGGTPLPFPENTTITINPSSVYAAAVFGNVDTASVYSVAVSMIDANNGNIFQETGNVTPCFIVTCDTNTQQCTNGSSMSFIAESTAPG